MFGLMKAKTCSAPAEVRLRRRMHYCGSCKTIGRLYGQKARLLLNNDTVFLAELLTALSGEDRDLGGWAARYQSYNCMSLPREKRDMPLALQLAAAATMVMAQFKIADQMADSQGRRWKLARRFYRESFARATAALKEWDFPLDELNDCWKAQIEIERSDALPSGLRWDEELLAYAAPTRKATGLFFEQAARIACNGLSATEMGTLGRSFGELIYCLDALEDYEKDARSGEFNPLRNSFPSADGRLDPGDRDRTVELVQKIRLEIESALTELPMPPERARMFTSRLRGNLSGRLGIKLPVIGPANSLCTHHAESRMSIWDRLREALILGRRLTTRHLKQECSSWGSYILAPFLFAYSAAVALAFPDEARTLGSVRESFGMPFNLILVGGLARSWPRIILKPIPSSHPPGGGAPEAPPVADAAEEARKHAEMAAESTKKGGGGCGCCDSDCCCDCGDCDCCCDCGDCC